MSHFLSKTKLPRFCFYLSIHLKVGEETNHQINRTNYHAIKNKNHHAQKKC